MKKQPLADMSGRWVLSTFEAFDTLLSRGYVAASPGSYSRKTKYLVIDNEGIHRYSDEVSLSIRFSEAYYHKGHFYDEPQDDTITEEKVPFPEMGFEPNIIKSEVFEVKNEGCVQRNYSTIIEYPDGGQQCMYYSCVAFDEEVDPHADLKAKYEEALKVYDVVKVFYKKKNSTEWEISDHHHVAFSSAVDYRLEFHNIDWNKVLEWSYYNGEFVDVELGDNNDYDVLTKLIGYTGKLFVGYGGSWRECCRLAPNVTIQDEWLTEVKQ